MIVTDGAGAATFASLGFRLGDLAPAEYLHLDAHVFEEAEGVH